MHPRVILEKLISNWKPYREPRFCYDNEDSEGSVEGTKAGNRTNELFEMISMISRCLDKLEQQMNENKSP